MKRIITLAIVALVLYCETSHAQCPFLSPIGAGNCHIGPGSVSLSASGSTGLYRWYDASTGGNFLFQGSNFNTPFISSTTNYHVAAIDTIASLEFDGANDYVALNMNYAGSGIISVLTVEAWIKTSYVGSAYNDNWAIIDFDRSEYYNLFVRGDDGQVGFSTTDNTSSTDDFYSGIGSVVNDGEWHHIAAVYDGTDKIIYIDGVEVARKVNAHGGNSLGTGATRFGMLGDGSESISFNADRNNLYYNGAIDEARIWNSVRTPTQISTYKDSCLAGSEPGLQAYFNMNEGTGTTLNDVTGNGNDGTLFNFATATCWKEEAPTFCTVCESSRTAVTATISGGTAPNLGGNLCSSNASETLDAGAGFSSYLWNTAEITQSINVTTEGTYFVQVDDGGGCTAADTITVGFVSIPVGKDSCSSGTGAITLVATGSNHYNWYDAAIGGNLVGTGDTFVTPVLTTTTSYYVAGTDTMSGLTFDGTNDYVALDYSYNTSFTTFTVEAWVKTTFSGSSYSDNWAIVDFDRSEYYSVYVRGDNGQVGFSTSDNTSSIDDFSSGAGNTVNDGQWHHIAVAYDGTDKIIYIDGIEVARNISAHGGNSLGTGLTRFGFLGDGSEAASLNGGRNNIYFDGEIDEVRIWNSSRSAGNINTFKDSCLNGDESDLVAYYNLDEGTGTSITDLTGNGHTGTLYNFNISLAWNSGAPISCDICESIRDEVIATIAPGPNFTDGQLSCGTPSFTLDAGAGYVSYLWSTGETTQTISASSQGVYSISASGGSCPGTVIDTVSIIGHTSGGSSLIFDGANDYVAIDGISYSNPHNVAVTVECWIKTSDGTDQVIASYDRNEYWRMEINGSGGGTGQIGWDLMTDAGQIDFASSSRVDDGNWHHVACVFDNGTLNIYIDGILDATTTSGTAFGSGNTRFGFVGIGSEATSFNGTTGPSDYFNGEMDEFRIWNSARTQAEIRGAMCSHVVGNSANLDTYFKFDEPSSSIVQDWSTANNHMGTLVNFAGSPKTTSTIPLGDASDFLYTGSFGGQSVTLSSCANDSVSVHDVLGNPDGVHVYFVNNDPNSITDIPNYTSGNHYFGTFIVNGTSPQYDLTYHYTNHPLVLPGDEDCLSVLSRTDESVTNWTLSSSDVNTATATILDPTHIGAQFILDKYQIQWTGVTSTDWATGTNWSINSVPVSGSNIQIPNVTNQPVLDMNRSIGKLTIDASSDIDLNGLELSLSGNLLNNGFINHSNGILNFNGTLSNQSITTSASTQLYDLTIDNSNGVDIASGSINLLGSLTLTDGTFNTNNALTLVSNISGTARIAEITGGSILNDVTAQRYIPAGVTDFRLLTSPISGKTLADWDDDFITAGFPSSNYPSFSFVSIQSYNESILGDKNQGWVNPSGISDAIATGQGYYVYCGDASGGTAPITIDITGTPITGTQVIGLTYTDDPGQPADQDGWNLIGNPYASPVDFTDLSHTSIDNGYWIRDPQSGNMESWDETTSLSALGLADGNLASAQGL
ncbi:MAG: hypothetical protein JKY54_19070, partial [Flavobacteriales bacterium]|nr:hypothetical protein [Flavobacteriales bacterium]